MNTVDLQNPQDTIRYRKLPGRGLRRRFFFVERTQLWLGPDHILSLERVWAEETYKRFYFRDIHSILVRQTSAWLWVVIPSLLLALGAGAMIWPVLQSDPTNGPGFAIALGVIAGVFGIFGVLKLIAGPSCKAHLQTEVQSIELPSLHTVRTAQRVLSILVPLIEEGQGHVTEEDLRRSESLPPRPLPHKARRNAKPVNYAHLILFLALITDCVLGLIYVSSPKTMTSLESIGSLISQLEIVLAVIALFWSRGAMGGGIFRLLSVLAVVLGVASFVAGIYFAVASAPMLAQSVLQNQQTPFARPHLDFSSVPGFVPAVIVSAVCSGALGIPGLILWFVHRARERDGEREREREREQNPPSV